MAFIGINMASGLRALGDCVLGMGDYVLGMGWGNMNPTCEPHISVPQVLGYSRHQGSGKREWLPHFYQK